MKSLEDKVKTFLCEQNQVVVEDVDWEDNMEYDSMLEFTRGIIEAERGKTRKLREAVETILKVLEAIQ